MEGRVRCDEDIWTLQCDIDRMSEWSNIDKWSLMMHDVMQVI